MIYYFNSKYLLTYINILIFIIFIFVKICESWEQVNLVYKKILLVSNKLTKKLYLKHYQ